MSQTKMSMKVVSGGSLGTTLTRFYNVPYREKPLIITSQFAAADQRI